MALKIPKQPIHNSTFIPVELTEEQELRFFRNRSISTSRPDFKDEENSKNIPVSRIIGAIKDNDSYWFDKKEFIKLLNKDIIDNFNILITEINNNSICVIFKKK